VCRVTVFATVSSFLEFGAIFFNLGFLGSVLSCLLWVSFMLYFTFILVKPRLARTVRLLLFFRMLRSGMEQYLFFASGLNVLVF